jgi:multimeric flavodoxin WrbA
MSILFINGSPDRDGTTARLAATLLAAKYYETVQLPEHRINPYGSTLEGDEFDWVLGKMRAADTIVIGSPVYWHNICGAVRNLLDRFYGPVRPGELAGRKLVFLYQGEAPEKWMLDAGEYTMSRFAGLYGMGWLGMAVTQKDAKALAKKL